MHLPKRLTFGFTSYFLLLLLFLFLLVMFLLSQKDVIRYAHNDVARHLLRKYGLVNFPPNTPYVST